MSKNTQKQAQKPVKNTTPSNAKQAQGSSKAQAAIKPAQKANKPGKASEHGGGCC